MLSWEFINSNFFQAIITLLTIVGGAYFGARVFHSQQRAKRLEKLYFEDSIARYLNILEENTSSAIKNQNLFARALDQIKNLGQRMDKEHLLNSIKESFDSIRPPSPIGLVNGQLNAIFTGSSNHFAQWISKAQTDFDFLYERIRGQLELFYKRIQDNKKIDLIKAAEIFHRLNATYISTQRHYIFQRLFESLMRNFAEFDFKNVKSINNFANESAIAKNIRDIDESFRLLFGFYQAIEDKTIWYSYAEEDGKCFKLTFGIKDGDVVLKELTKETRPKSQDLFMILFDDVVGVSDAYVDGISFPHKLIKIAKTKIGFREPIAMSYKKYFIEHDPLE